MLWRDTHDICDKSLQTCAKGKKYPTKEKISTDLEQVGNVRVRRIGGDQETGQSLGSIPCPPGTRKNIIFGSQDAQPDVTLICEMFLNDNNRNLTTHSRAPYVPCKAKKRSWMSCMRKNSRNIYNNGGRKNLQSSKYESTGIITRVWNYFKCILKVLENLVLSGQTKCGRNAWYSFV